MNMRLAHRWYGPTRLCFGVAVLALLLADPAAAGRKALLVGIGDYHAKPLSGPVHDVRAMRKALVQRWHFKESDIVTILNKDATKTKILAAINALHEQTKAGDQIFVYFSGHGTSADDADLAAPLPTTSGAFIPIDIDGATTADAVIERLIIGRRDLKPLLLKLDEGGRHVFVAIDACYSGNTVRGTHEEDRLPMRSMTMPDLIPKAAFGADLRASGEAWSKRKAQNNSSDTGYPYKNIYYLSAAGEHEPAQDIPAEMLRVYPTVDGKPHGAFTDTLLRVLNKEIDSDINQDGLVSYGELKQAVRNLMRIRGFNHTPQGLPTLAEDRGNLAQRGIFAADTPATSRTSVVVHASADRGFNKADQIANGPDAYTIRLGMGVPATVNPSAVPAGVAVVSADEHVRLEMEGKDVIVVSAAGDIVARLVGADETAVLQYLKRQARIHALLNREFVADFSLELDLHGAGRGGTALEGEDIGFSVRVAQTAHVLILDIDPHGLITVLYPYLSRELEAVPANELVDLPHVSQVRAPYGRDYVVAYAFDRKIDDIELLRAQRFTAESPLMDTLERLLGANAVRRGRSSLELITVDTPPKEVATRSHALRRVQGASSDK